MLYISNKILDDNLNKLKSGNKLIYYSSNNEDRTCYYITKFFYHSIRIWQEKYVMLFKKVQNPVFSFLFVLNDTI